MAAANFLLITLFLCALVVDGSHFRGGTITWRPWNNTPSGTTFSILIRQRWSWRRTFSAATYCDDTTIASSGSLINAGNLICGAGNCAIYTPSPLSTQTYCTDFNAGLDVSSGEVYDTRTYLLNSTVTISFYSSAWFAGLYVGSNQDWQVSNRINTMVRPDGYINTSPIAVTLPIIYKPIATPIVHVVQMSDFDGSDILKCRWSQASGGFTGADECRGICNGVPGANLIGLNCTIVFSLATAGVYAGVALQIEDFFNAAALSANTPMTSVPLQFLFYGYAIPSGCSTPPAITGERPNRACIGTPIGSNVTEYVIVEVYCAGKTIVDFITSTPVGMRKSSITALGGGKYQMILSWVPVAGQYGPQSFCAGAIDNTNIQSNQWCITFLVGFESPDVIRPKLVQGSASPIGTIFKNHTTFSIQTSKFVNRPTRNGTNIYFWDVNDNTTTVAQFDCGYDLNVTYTGYTIIIRFQVTPWQDGHFYYVTFDGGVASGTEFCGPESAAVKDQSYWRFNIWNPAVSSTTTTTTTPPTTITVTTRPTSTTSINTALTTTGIVITTTTPLTTSSTTPSTAPPTTGVPTTAGPTTSPATTESTVAVLYPKDLELACLQPIAMMNAVLLVVMMPIHALAMYAAFTKFSNMFKPANIDAKARHKRRMKRTMV